MTDSLGGMFPALWGNMRLRLAPSTPASPHYNRSVTYTWQDIVICAVFALVVLAIIIWQAGWPSGSHDLVERAIKERLSMLSLYLVECRSPKWGERVPATGYAGSKQADAYVYRADYRRVTVRDRSGNEMSAWARVCDPPGVIDLSVTDGDRPGPTWPDYTMPYDIGWNPPLVRERASRASVS